MSIKTFLSNLWTEIRSIFYTLPAELQRVAHIAVSITENLKTVVDGPLVDILTAVIPGDTDDKLVGYLRLRLPVILQELRLIDAALITASGSQIVSNATANLQKLSGDTQNAFLHDLGVLIAREIADIIAHGLSWSDAVYVIEWYYQNKFKQATNKQLVS